MDVYTICGSDCVMYVGFVRFVFLISFRLFVLISISKNWVFGTK